MSYKYTFATWEQYLIYLRKSRSDDPNETVEQVLAKHEIMLQEYALREFGHKIPESNIYREVVSGESIEAREEIKKVLSRIEDPNIKGVIVIEPSRLSRGDLLDCGRLINDLRYTKTVVVTPVMTYDLENKMERKFFQDELLRGSDYLEYTKEILWRGRVAAVKRGCYVARFAPYGYKKIKVGKDSTLEIDPEQAEVVRMIFDFFTKEKMSQYAIAKKMNELGIKPPRNEKWTKGSIRSIVHNEQYTGKVVFSRKRKTTLVVDGERVVKRVKSAPDEVIIAEGKHPAIIDMATWEAAQNAITNHPRHKMEVELKNPLASVLVCGKCGTPLNYHTYKEAFDRYECRKHVPRCFKSARVDGVQEAVLVALQQSELPALKLKVKNDDGNARNIQLKVIARLEKQLAEFDAQEEKQFDLLEQGVYSQEVFERRHTALVAKMKACREEITKARVNMPKSVDYAERVAALQNAIDILKDDTATVEQKNKIVRAIVDRIEFYGMPAYTSQTIKNEYTLKVFLRI